MEISGKNKLSQVVAVAAVAMVMLTGCLVGQDGEDALPTLVQTGSSTVLPLSLIHI